VAVSFIYGGNRRKLPTCRKSPTNFITEKSQKRNENAGVTSLKSEGILYTDMNLIWLYQIKDQATPQNDVHQNHETMHRKYIKCHKYSQCNRFRPDRRENTKKNKLKRSVLIYVALSLSE